MPHKRKRQKPQPAKPCVIVNSNNKPINSDNPRYDDTKFSLFPSRIQAKKALAALILTLPPKQSSDEPKKYLIVNV